MSRLAVWSDQSCVCVCIYRIKVHFVSKLRFYYMSRLAAGATNHVCVCIYRIKVHFVSGLRFYYISRLAAWSDQSYVCVYIHDKSAFC